MTSIQPGDWPIVHRRGDTFMMHFIADDSADDPFDFYQGTDSVKYRGRMEVKVHPLVTEPLIVIGPQHILLTEDGNVYIEYNFTPYEREAMVFPTLYYDLQIEEMASGIKKTLFGGEWTNELDITP